MYKPNPIRTTTIKPITSISIYLILLVGHVGFEPTIPSPQTRCDSQTSLMPDLKTQHCLEILPFVSKARSMSYYTYSLLSVFFKYFLIISKKLYQPSKQYPTHYMDIKTISLVLFRYFYKNHQYFHISYYNNHLGH